MAENKTINIKINQNADKAEQSFKSYNKELGNTKKQYDAVLKSGKPFDQQLEDINRIVKETPLNVRDMNKQIQAYQSIALSAGRETPVGKQALEQAAQLRDRYQDIQNETKRLADDQRNLEGAMQGIATGVAVYGGVQSAMALAGTESEQLRETLVKLQAAQTLMNSINQVATALEKESALMLTLKNAKTKALTISQTLYTAATGKATKATKAFKAALITSGIGALVVALGAIVAYWDDITKAMGGAAAEGQKLADQAREEAELATQKYNDSVKYADILRAQGKSEEYIRDLQMQELSIAIQKGEVDVANAKQQKELAIESTKFNRKVLDMILKVILVPIETMVRAYNVAASAVPGLEQVTLVSTQIAEAVFDIKDTAAEADEAIAQAETRLKDLKNQQAQIIVAQRQQAKQTLKDRIDQRRRIEDIENELMEDGIEKELEMNRDKFRRLREDVKGNSKESKKLRQLLQEQEEQAETEIRDKYDKIKIDEELKLQEEFDKIRQENEARFKSEQENELDAVAYKYDVLKNMAQGNAEALNEIEIARLNEENDIKQKYAQEAADAQKAIDDKAKADRDKATKKEKADAKALAEYKFQVAQQSLTAIGDIAKLFAKGNEKQQKRAFQVQKAVGIAQATINTAQAITKVFAETTDFTPTQSLRIANAVAIGLAGAAQVASIASQQFEGGGNVESPSGTGGGGSEAVAPSFNVVGDSSINQLAQLQQQPTQAFVVSGEVTSAQALDRNRVTNATL
jgi:hypothetical protein